MTCKTKGPAPPEGGRWAPNRIESLAERDSTRRNGSPQAPMVRLERSWRLEPDRADPIARTLSAELRCAILRAEIAAADLRFVATALEAGFIDVQSALSMLDANAIDYLEYGGAAA